MSDELFTPVREDFVVANKQEHQPKAKVKEKNSSSKKNLFISFIKNPSTIVGLALLFLTILIGVIPPLASSRNVSYNDGIYVCVLPKIDAFEGSGFWDGTYKTRVNEKRYYSLLSIGAGELDKDGLSFDQSKYKSAKTNPIKKVVSTYHNEGKKYRELRLDSYYEVGFHYDFVNLEKYQKIVEYETKSGLKVLYPMIDTRSDYAEDENNANLYYFSKGLYPCNKDGEYVEYESGNIVTSPKDNYLRIYPNYLLDNDDNPVFYVKTGNTYKIRVLYYNYYQFEQWLIHGGKQYRYSPSCLLGSDAQGYDILLRISSGIRLSLLLALAVFSINFIIGTIYGIIEGYYGGKADFILFHLAEILRAIPLFIIATIFATHFINKGVMSTFIGLLFAFCLTGWISIASQTRRQIYRFKNRDFVFASRQLGANDFHIVFKHIYPHAISSLITSLILFIPGVIFNETALSYLGVVNFNGEKYTSLGTMIANGQEYLSNYTHILFFPALVICIIMIAFNLIGNGLRESFDRKSWTRK